MNEILRWRLSTLDGIKYIYNILESYEKITEYSQGQE